MILIDGDYTIRMVDFPDARIGGAVMLDGDGHYNIYVNSRRSWEAQRESMRHELDHILNDDFHNGKPIEEVEA